MTPHRTPAQERAARRTAVSRLTAQGLSRRAIADQLGVGKDTVRRDLEALACAGAPGGAPHPAPGAPPSAPGAPGGAPPGAPDSLTVPLDAELAEDLAVLAHSGWTPADAVRRAVALLADTYRCAWDHGDCPDGVPPTVRGVRYAEAEGPPPGAPGGAP